MPSPIILNQRLNLKTKALEEKRSALAELAKSEKEIETRAAAVKTDKELDAISKESDELETVKTSLRSEVETLEEKRAELEKEIEEANGQENRSAENKGDDKMFKEVKRNNPEEAEARGFIDYINSRGQKRDAVKTTDLGAIMPKSVSYTPQEEVEAQYDLTKVVDVVPVTTAGGSYFFSKRSNQRFYNVEEDAENPQIGIDGLRTVEYNLKTYRGVLPFTNETLQDVPAAMNLMNKTVNETMINTKNALIAEQLQKATKVEAKTLDELKEINNVKLSAYTQKSVVASPTAYNYLDTLKDGNGNYILQRDVTSPSGMTVLGLPIYKTVDDSQLGGENTLFIGDGKRFTKYFDRLEVAVSWANNDRFGERLMGAIRADVKNADEKAGYLVHFSSDGATSTKK